MFVPVVAALTLTPSVVTSAYAQDEGDDLEGGDEDKGKKKKHVSAEESAGTVREIVRGFYAKANVGAATYFGTLAPVVNGGTYVGLAVGQDFVDTEKQSMAWEIALTQGLHNGLDYENGQAGNCLIEGGSYPCTEGDLRTYALQATYELSFYPTRRLGVGFRAGAGVLYSPLLIPTEALSSDPDLIPSGWHNSPKPIVLGGPTLEYYTKLSHFSVGVDIDVVYGIGWDIGLNGSGALKYTF
jgi:hypothetical protein